ncbi:hypothetical protein ACS0TY_025898 [Phlomoides rotata]
MIRPQVVHIRRCRAWHKPLLTFSKLNVDVDRFEDTHEMCIDIVIHDDNGEFVACRSLVIPGIYKVEEGEAMRLLEPLLWLKQLGLQRVQVEVDAKACCRCCKFKM